MVGADLALPAKIEEAIRVWLEEDEIVLETVDGLVSRWLFLTYIGEFFAQPAALVLTDRRIFLFDVEHFSNRVAGLNLSAPRDLVPATFTYRWWRYRRGFFTLQGRWGRLRLVLPEDKVNLYVDRFSITEAKAGMS